MQADLLERASLAGAPLRKAAMLLHSMGEADRHWMLERLDAGQRPRIEALLSELRALEYPADPDLVRESLTGAVATRAAPTAATGLAGWSVEQAAQVLLAEPDDVIALLLRAGAWPWADGLRSRLDAERARRVEGSRFTRSAEVSPALIDAATRAARARLDALRDEASAARGGRLLATSRRAS